VYDIKTVQEDIQKKRYILYLLKNINWKKETRCSNTPCKNEHVEEQNVKVEWLAPVLCIWEVLDSSLSPETGYPD
jgi:hypothetical protein